MAYNLGSTGITDYNNLPPIDESREAPYYNSNIGANTPTNGFNWNDFTQGIGNLGTGLLNMMPGVGSGQLGLASMIPAFTAAYQQWKDADRYEQAGMDAANRADPWGQANREKSQGMLWDTLEDPTKSPVYQSMLRTGLEQLNPKMASMGLAGSGALTADQTRLYGDVANKYLGEWADRYAGWGGANFNPANAAEMQMRGVDSAIKAKNGALDALFAPFGMQAYGNAADSRGLQNPITNQGTGGSRGGASSPQNFQQALALARQLTSFGIDPQTAASLAGVGITPDGNGGFQVSDPVGMPFPGSNPDGTTPWITNPNPGLGLNLGLANPWNTPTPINTEGYSLQDLDLGDTDWESFWIPRGD